MQQPHRLALVLACTGLLAACASTPAGGPRLGAGGDPAASCLQLAATPGPPSAIGLPSGAATVDSATLVAASPLVVAERGATPSGRITPAMPAHCRVLGRIAPVDLSAPPILFQLNLPVEWN